MNLSGRLSLAVLVAGVAFCSRADAQGLTGSLMGTVKDPTGSVVSGAAVRVTSPDAPGGPRESRSDERGEWRLPLLPPGRYVLEIDLQPGFALHRQEVRVGSGEAIELPVVLRVADVTQSVNVEAAAAMVRTSGIETRFDANFVRLVPSRRNSMFSLISNAPGVSPTSPSSGSINSVSVFGSAVNENAFLIDGTNFTCPCQGVSRAEPMVDVIQELHVQSMGASVEFGNLQGAVFNVVTRQGGDRFAGEVSYYGQPSAFTAQPVVLPVRGGSTPESGYDRARYRDLSTNGGGPVKSGHLWFFAAYQYLRDYDSQPGTDPAFPRRYEQNKVFAKLNWRFTPSLQLMQSFHQENWVNPTPATLSSPFETTQRVHASVPNMTFGHLTHTLSSRTLWEVRVGRFLLQQDADPSSGDRTAPSRTDQITGVSRGNAAQITTLHLDRITAKAVLHHYLPDWLKVAHDLRAGVQIERGEHRLLQVLPGGVRYVDSNGAPFQAIFREPSIAGGVFVTPAVFASDRIRISERMTVDAGLRFDRSQAVNPDLPVVSADGYETEDRLEGRGTLYTQHSLSPRAGMNVRLDAAGRTWLRGSYGRFNQGVLTGELDPVSQGSTATTTMAFDPATQGYTRLVSVVRPTLNISIDENTRSPHTDEYSLALDREITRELRASVAYIRKRGDNFIGWIDRGGQYRQDTVALPDGTTLPVQTLTNGTADRRFFLTNPDNLSSAYDGIVIAVDRRLASAWQASVSYTYSQSRGLQVMSNGTADDPQFSTIARPGFLTFGQDPNDWTNGSGRLPNDRPHVFRSTGLVRLPWQGVLIAGNLQVYSGKPWAATTQVTLPQGSRRILLEPRGTRRLSAQSLLDLRVSKSFRIGSAAAVDVMLDALNLLGDNAEEALVSDNRFSTTFGVPRLFIDPRRVMLGARLNLGR